MVLDAAGAALLLFLFLALPESPLKALGVVLNEAYFFGVLLLSLWRLQPANTLLAALCTLVGASLAIACFGLLAGLQRRPDRAHIGEVEAYVDGRACLHGGARHDRRHVEHSPVGRHRVLIRPRLGLREFESHWRNETIRASLHRQHAVADGLD